MDANSPPAPARPTAPFVAASLAALALGVAGVVVGLWNSDMQPNEKGYYLAVLLLGLFAAVSLQKTVRDRAEGIPVTGAYYGMCWLALGSAVALATVGLWNATMAPSEKGFYGMAFGLALFGAVVVQKNVRDGRQGGAAASPRVAAVGADWSFRRAAEES
jgi:uncharacterized membrane protein YiaA